MDDFIDTLPNISTLALNDTNTYYENHTSPCPADNAQASFIYGFFVGMAISTGISVGLYIIFKFSISSDKKVGNYEGNGSV